MIKSFIFLNFMVSLFSDIVLNDLSKSGIYDKLSTLRPYFKDKYILQAGVYAGVTIVIGLVLLLLLSKTIFDFYAPNNIKDLIRFIIIAYPLGYIYDYLIYKYNIFGNSLKLFYKEFGVGHWGALAFIFSIVVSYFLHKYFIRLII
mgnify:CR=1 FL=1|tara:strand:- start:563 stop:1000 length:438 start_codon:yes stop_codon:yes gene_type:complete